MLGTFVVESEHDASKLLGRGTRVTRTRPVSSGPLLRRRRRLLLRRERQSSADKVLERRDSRRHCVVAMAVSTQLSVPIRALVSVRPPCSARPGHKATPGRQQGRQTRLKAGAGGFPRLHLPWLTPPGGPWHPLFPQFWRERRARGGDRARTFVTSRARPDDETLIAPPQSPGPPAPCYCASSSCCGLLENLRSVAKLQMDAPTGLDGLHSSTGWPDPGEARDPPGLDEQLPSQPAHAALGAWTPSLPRRAPRRLAWSWAAGWSSE